MLASQDPRLAGRVAFTYPNFVSYTLARFFIVVAQIPATRVVKRMRRTHALAATSAHTASRAATFHEAEKRFIRELRELR